MARRRDYAPVPWRFFAGACLFFAVLMAYVAWGVTHQPPPPKTEKELAEETEQYAREATRTRVLRVLAENPKAMTFEELSVRLGEPRCVRPRNTLPVTIVFPSAPSIFVPVGDCLSSVEHDYLLGLNFSCRTQVQLWKCNEARANLIKALDESVDAGGRWR